MIPTSIVKSPAKKTDDELKSSVADLIAVLNHDHSLGRDLWSCVAALHAHTQEQRSRHYAPHQNNLPQPSNPS